MSIVSTVPSFLVIVNTPVFKSISKVFTKSLVSVETLESISAFVYLFAIDVANSSIIACKLLCNSPFIAPMLLAAENVSSAVKKLFIKSLISLPASSKVAFSVDAWPTMTFGNADTFFTSSVNLSNAILFPP